METCKIVKIFITFYSNFCSIFRVEWSTKWLGVRLFEGGTKFYYCENIEKIREKMQIFRKFFNFLVGHKFLIMGKINNLIWTCWSAPKKKSDN